MLNLRCYAIAFMFSSDFTKVFECSQLALREFVNELFRF